MKHPIPKQRASARLFAPDGRPLWAAVALSALAERFLAKKKCPQRAL
jgi:hypothetical protein